MEKKQKVKKKIKGKKGGGTEASLWPTHHYFFVGVG